MNFDELKRFLEEKMDVRQANYQPVFIKTLLHSENYSVPKEKIAQALKDFNPGKERNFNAIVDEIYRDVLGEPGTHKIITQNEYTRNFTLKLDEVDESRIEILDSICMNKINEYDQTQGITVNDEKFTSAHKMFEDFILKNSGFPFVDFNNPYLLEKEINYKRKIIDKTSDLRTKQKWNEWKEIPGRIIEELKKACSPSICKNLIMGSNYGVQGSSAASLYLVIPELVSELEQALYDFFIVGMNSENEFAEKFNALIDFLRKNSLKVDWRFLAYLAFLANPNRYFPIQPTKFEKLIQYYGNSVRFRATFSWELYSTLLQLANILKLKLAKYGELDAIQVQSYMWIVSRLIEMGGAPMINYWVISPGESAENWSESIEKGIISVNWLANEDLTNITEKVLQQKLSGKKFTQVRDFMFKIKEGDMIMANKGQDEILGIGTVKGPYKYRPDLNYPHTIPVEWNIDKKGNIPRQNSWYSTVKPISKGDFDRLLSHLENLTESPPPEFEEYQDILLKKKQIIFYGPPGTGKTFTANNFAKWFVSTNKKRATFEESQHMTDDQFNQFIIDEIRRLAESKNYEFVKDPETYNLFSLKSAHNEIRLAIAFSKSEKQTPDEVFLGVSDRMIDFLEQVPIENQFLVIVNNDSKNFVVLPYEIEQKYSRFVAGKESGKWDSTGKRQHAFRIIIARNEAKMPVRDGTYSEKYYDCSQYLGNLEPFGIGNYEEPSEFVQRVTFHPSYSYEEFVEGIRPRSREDHVIYPLENGIFKTICNDARNDPNNKYVLIIDEINRGNISKILGELITLIEKDKRDTFTLLLTYSKKYFTVPDNLYIIGTMNTADRSLTQLDTAIRRRFAFCELLPNENLLDKTIDGIQIGQLLAKLNEKIRNEGLREKQIGHSYFMDGDKCIESIEDLRFVFANEIIPLLQEYFYEDYDKLQKILGSRFIDEKEMKIKDEWKINDTVFLEALRPFVASS